MERYQSDYQAIPIPEELDAAVSRGLRRGRLRRLVRKSAGVSGLAAVLALVLLTASVPMLPAGAAEVPVLGALVRMLRIGSGGTAETGKAVTMTAEWRDSALRLTFARPDGSAAEVPVFSLIRRAGEHWVLRLHGLASPDPDAVIKSVLNLSAVEDAWPMACTDEQELGLVLRLRPGFVCTAAQYGAPAALLLSFSETDLKSGEEYILCSDPLAFGPELARQTEDLLWEGAFQLRRPDGRYQIVLGRYPTRERAELALSSLQPDMGLSLHVERCAPAH